MCYLLEKERKDRHLLHHLIMQSGGWGVTPDTNHAVSAVRKVDDRYVNRTMQSRGRRSPGPGEGP